MYKIILYFHIAKKYYLLGIVTEETMQGACNRILADRAKPNTAEVDPMTRATFSYKFEALAAGPATLAVSPLRTTEKIWVELTGDAPYYL